MNRCMLSPVYVSELEVIFSLLCPQTSTGSLICSPLPVNPNSAYILTWNESWTTGCCELISLSFSSQKSLGVQGYG